MDSRAIVGLVAAALVVILAAIPILSSYGEFTEVEDNSSPYLRYSEYTGETLNIVFGADNTATVNGAAVADFEFHSATLQIQKNSAGIYLNEWSDQFHAQVVEGDTVTISRYTATGTGGLSALDSQIPRGQAIYVDPAGDYAQFSGAFFLDKNAVAYIFVESNPSLFAKGTLGGFTVLNSKGFSGNAFVDYTVTDIELTYTEVEGASGTALVSGSSYKSNGVEATNSVVVAPIEYHAPSDGGVVGTLTDLIPLLLVISLLIAAVGFVAFKRY